MRSLARAFTVYCLYTIQHGFYHITRHEGYMGLVHLNNKKNPVFVQVIVLFAGINDIIHGWTINTVTFPKTCYRLWESHCTMDDAPSNQKINLFSKF